MSSKCISCKKLVRARQQGLQCDGCNRWQHRVCGTGISLADYREAVQTDSPIDWRCAECMSESLLPVAESTPVDFVANSVLESDIDEPTADEPVPDSGVRLGSTPVKNGESLVALQYSFFSFPLSFCLLSTFHVSFLHGAK